MHGNDVIPRVRRRRTKLRHGRMVPGRNIEREREREREREGGGGRERNLLAFLSFPLFLLVPSTASLPRQLK